MSPYDLGASTLRSWGGDYVLAAQLSIAGPRSRALFHKDALEQIPCYDVNGTIFAETQAYHREECIVYPAFAVMIGFMFGFIVAEIAHRYFEIDLPMFF